MKSRILTCTTAMTLFAALAIALRLAAQEQQQQKAEKPQHYTVTDLGTLGGTFGFAEGINNKGLVDGVATLPGDNNQHVFLWQNGVITDVGTLVSGLGSRHQFSGQDRRPWLPAQYRRGSRFLGDPE